MDSFTHRLNELLLWPLEKEDFFMSLIAVQSNNSNKIGTCPHGLPQGACPICSGMGGGMKKADFSAKPGEMSWNECAAIGAFLKAQKMAKLQREQDAQNFANNVRTFQNAMMNASQKLANIGGFFSQNTPSIIAKPVNFVLNTVLGGIARGIANIPTTISNIIQTVQQKLADISDKLTAIIGAMIKNRLTQAVFDYDIAKKISETFNSLKKKVKSLFSIFKPLNSDNDDKQVDETKKAFKLKTFIHDLYKKIIEKEINDD